MAAVLGLYTTVSAVPSRTQSADDSSDSMSPMGTHSAEERGLRNTDTPQVP